MNEILKEWINKAEGEFATKEQAKFAIKSMEKLRDLFRNLVK